ncbi:GspE/PulE family protein [Aliidiomarina sanyensis]|nr:ATPase, T2SS/T4P/T4SS family [Aliidiomarina sanyensis]
MDTIETLSDLGYSQVHEDALTTCLELSAEDDACAVVVLADGRVLASETSWQQQMPALLALTYRYINAEQPSPWHRASADLIRTLLTDADGLRRAREQFVGDSEGSSLALQSLHDMVNDALTQGASDIHIRLSGLTAQIRYRVDGLLIPQLDRSRVFVTEVVAAALQTQSDDHVDIFDERQISSATISLEVGVPAQPIRLRVQKSPCRDGFTVTLRLQRIGQGEVPTLAQIGLDESHRQTMQHLMAQPSGIVFISGPTGHGKTTTLAALNEAVPATRKIISLEDPIEIIQPRVDQKLVVQQAGQRFAELLKVALREDPDIVEVSEIRDLETAQAALSAALTGHLVLSTIHATDAIGIIARLHDLGVPLAHLAQPGLFAGLIAQRLLPKLCSECRRVDSEGARQGVYRRNAKGCSACHYAGVKGRVLVCEVIVPGDEGGAFIRTMDTQEWRQSMTKRGFRSLAQDAYTLVRQGTVDWHDASELVPGLSQLLLNDLHGGAQNERISETTS